MMNLIDYILQLRKKRVHVFCIGAAKTGTTSISHIYNPVFRAAHEPEVNKTTNLIIDYLSKTISVDECKKQIIDRDRKLNLELESSHPLGYLAPHLVELFPNAKFIVTIRDPKSWLKSRVNFHFNKTPSEWIKYRDFIWSKHHNNYEKEEAYLQENGLYSLEAYLKQYSEQYKIIFNSVPKERMILIKTSEISSSVDKISNFIGYKGKNLHPIHTNKLEKNLNLETKISPKFVDEKVKQYCGWISEQFF